MYDLRYREIMLSACFSKDFWEKYGEVILDSEEFRTNVEQDILDYLNEQWSNGHPPTPEHMLTELTVDSKEVEDRYRNRTINLVADDANHPGVVEQATQFVKGITGEAQRELDERLKREQAEKLAAQKERAKKIEEQTIKEQTTALLPLPHYKIPDVDLAEVCPWLVNFIEWNSIWSPRTPYPMHLTIGLGYLSMVAGGRVRIDGAGKPNFTNLYLAVVGPTTKPAKTTAMLNGWKGFKRACKGNDLEGAIPWYERMSMKHLIDNSYVTPQRFVEMRALNKAQPTAEQWERMSETEQEEVKAKLAFIGQTSWLYSEFGSKLLTLKSAEATIQEFGDIFLRFNDNDEDYTASTISRGNDEIEHPYATVMVTMVPKNFRENANRWRAGNGNDKLWANGFFPRFLFATPLTQEFSRKRWPKGVTFDVPEDVWKPLREWHDWLGAPDVLIYVEEPEDNKGKKFKKLNLSWRIVETPVMLSEEAHEHLYGDEEKYPEDHPLQWGFMGDLEYLTDYLPEDLHGNYLRLTEFALRIAALFASFERSDTIELRHAAAAMRIIEDVFRPGLHEVFNYDQCDMFDGVSEESLMEDKIRAKLMDAGRSRNSLRQMLNIKTKDGLDLLDKTLESMVANGELYTEVVGTTKKSEVYRLVLEEKDS